MKIYLVYRTDLVDYDQFDSWVVIAKTPKQAKELCEWGDAHPQPNELRAKVIKTGKKAKRILGSFNAG